MYFPALRGEYDFIKTYQDNVTTLMTEQCIFIPAPA